MLTLSVKNREIPPTFLSPSKDVRKNKKTTAEENTSYTIRRYVWKAYPKPHAEERPLRARKACQAAHKGHSLVRREDPV